MQEIEFQIGDIVYCDQVNNVIMADSKTPYRHINGDIYPADGCDFLIIPVNKPPNQVTQFKHVYSHNILFVSRPSQEQD